MTPFPTPVLVAAAAVLATAAPVAAIQGTAAAAQDTSAVAATGQATASPVPFGVGERLEYDVKFGSIKAGEGVMEVRGIETIRGRPAYHTYFQVKGGIPFFRVNDIFQSWIDTATLSSLRFVQDQDEGPKERQRRYEIYPDQQIYREYVKGEGADQPSVANPLDDGSFLYFLRTIPLEVGRTYTFDRYFRPDRNPVTIKVVRRERIKVPAGTFDAVVLQPQIKTKGLFGEDGHAEVWLSDDENRIMLQMKSDLKIGSLNLYLTKYRPANGSETR
ncbi:MAG TPA: DUF3108 domain-containing protein [Gemmatimonadaceae bacterium]|nr:DUF3108 domain-containing protein [Gemmatimonadaceae bacterium]